MLKEKTCCIIKPDAYPRYFGVILMQHIIPFFDISFAGEFRFNQERVEEFYHEHEGKPFFDHLTEVMIAGKCFGMVLVRVNAIAYLRELMGPVTISDRRPGEIRYVYGSAKDAALNAVHGSDSPESAHIEMARVRRYIDEVI